MHPAEEYCTKLNWCLVGIPAGTKCPTSFGWQKPENAISTPEQAKAFYDRHPTYNVGLLHAASGTCALDVDNVEYTRMIFKELGIDYDAIMASAPRIVGRSDRGKVIFKAPAGLGTHKISWPTKDDPRRTEVVFELRAGSVQDVLPPSIHPDTGNPYRWAGPSIFDGLPDLPPQLMTLWTNWDRFRVQLQDICPWKAKREFQPPRKPRRESDSTSVIDAFNDAHDMDQLLTQFGYKATGRGRYLSPNSTSGLAGVVLFDDGRAYSHHASDPFDSAHTFDAFDLWCQYEHMGNTTKAVKEAAAFLNINKDPAYEYDKDAIDHGAKVAATIMARPKVEGPLSGIPEHLLSVPGRLQDVVNYYETTAIKTQPQFAVQCALSFGSVVMGRRWVTDQRNFSSLYFLNIGETGCGKEHTKTVIEAILDEAQLGHLIGPSGYTSAPGVMSTLIKQPTHISIIDELGRMLKSASANGNHHKADSITAIMEVFGRQDGTLRPQGYATQTAKKDIVEALEKVVRRPSLTLVGMSTPKEFYDSISGGDVASGLLNRFLIVKTNIGVQMSKDKRSSQVGEQLRDWATAHAQATGGDLSGCSHDVPPSPIEVAFTPAARALLRSYEAELIDAIKAESGSGLEAMFNRSREVAMRLGLIVARSLERDAIDEDAIGWAIDYVRFYSGRAVSMFRDNMSDGPFQAACKAVFSKIESAGLKGVTESELSRTIGTFANLDPKRRKDVMEALVSDRNIVCRHTNAGQRGKPRMAWFSASD